MSQAGEKKLQPGACLIVTGGEPRLVMKLSIPLLVLGWTLLQPAAAQETAAPDGNAQFRTWRDRQGRTVEATFRGVEDGQIFLQTRNGYVHRLPLANLAEEDQKIAAALKP